MRLNKKTRNLNMKKLLFGALALTMLATACKKDDDNGPGNTFKVNSTTLTTSSVQSSGSTVTVNGTNGGATGGIIFSFPGTATPAAGTYKVVADATGANQVEFIAALGAGTTGTFYSSTGTGTVNAVVTINSGKITITMPDAPAKNITGTDVVNVSANVTQP